MELFHIIIVGIAGLYLTIFSLIMVTHGFLVTFFYKVLPFFIGLSCLFSTGKLFGLY